MPKKTDDKALTDLLAAMPAGRVVLLTEMAKALQRPITVSVAGDSDIVSEAFASDFTGRLLLFHAMHDAALTKKTFEYFFCGASRAAGRSAHHTENAVHAGEDITVDGVKFSLKTEGGKSISTKAVHISKFMEARWIRECRTGDDFCRLSHERILDHLKHYERIVTLRAFESGDYIKYDLVEIPRVLLEKIGTLRPFDFSVRSENGSSSAIVKGENGENLFTLSLDGSVEKVTVRNLLVNHCRIHAQWSVGMR
jgi:hypothetical protein